DVCSSDLVLELPADSGASASRRYGGCTSIPGPLGARSAGTTHSNCGPFRTSRLCDQLPSRLGPPGGYVLPQWCSCCRPGRVHCSRRPDGRGCPTRVGADGFALGFPCLRCVLGTWCTGGVPAGGTGGGVGSLLWSAGTRNHQP